MISKTPLYASHLACGAKMVDFHGWEMPLHYGSQLDEHHTVRNDAGMFDVSHMNVIDVLGAGGRQFLRHLLTNDVDTLQHTGRALYTCMCNDYGGIIDDLIVYQRAPDNYRLVLNSATRVRDLAWIREKIGGFSAGLQERTDLAMLAVQGPQAVKKVLTILNPAQVDALSTMDYFECVEIDNWFFARTGYTGEDGLEIIVPQNDIARLWTNLIDTGIKPCGLAARDTLRLEAGLLLYVMRAGQRVIVEGHPDGIITSGTWSPTLNQSIALARVPIETAEKVMIDIRGKLLPAKVGKPRFIKNGVPV
jgi:aminomethyltransferase